MNTKGQVSITGKVEHFKGLLNMGYYMPIAGCFNSFINKTQVVISGKGQFNITENISTGILCLDINNNVVYVPVSNGDSIEINISFDSLKTSSSPSISFMGKNAPGIILFNRIYSNPSITYEKINYLHDNFRNIPQTQIFNRLKIAIFSYINLFDSLLLKNKINASFYALSTTSIRATLLTEFLKPFVRKSNISKVLSKDEIQNLTEKIFNYCNPFDSLTFLSVLGYYYVDTYIRIHSDDSAIYSNPNKQYSLYGKKIQPDFVPYLGLKNKMAQELVWGMQLAWLKKLFPNDIVETDFSFFQYLFPRSEYNIYLKYLFSLDSMASSDNFSKRIVIDSSQTIKSLPQLKGHVYLVDLWASWCIPCIKNFEENERIDSFLHLKKMQRLYISIDDSSDKKNWLKNIKRYNLEGLHILASSALIKDIQKKVYKKGEALSIPRYFILTEKGIVANPNIGNARSNIFFSAIEKLIVK